MQGNAPKENHVIPKETLGELAPTYATVKKCVAQFKLCDFPRVMSHVLDETKQ